MGYKIEKIEIYLPDKIITNKDLSVEFPDYDFSKFDDKVGISSRRNVDEDQTALNMGISVGKKVLEDEDKESIDFLLYCTQSPEYFLPPGSCILQDKLSLRKNIGALDFNLGCSGYTYGINLAKSLLSSGNYNKILFITSETYSKYISKEDKSNRAIFGDAATATIISKNDENQIFSFVEGTDGSGYESLIVKNGAARKPVDNSAEVKQYGSNNKYTDNNLYMDGPGIFKFTTETIPALIKEILQKNNCNVEDIDQFIFHQANAFMLELLRKKCKIPKEKFYSNIREVGNTVSNTIPIAVKDYVKNYSGDKKILKIMIVGFGVGLSWSGGIININIKEI